MPVKKETKPLVNPFSENFVPHWERWKSYKKEQFRFSYKPMGEQSALDKLYRLSEGNEGIAREIIEEGISNGWMGLYAIKNNNNNRNGNTTGRNPEKPQPTGTVAKGGFGQF
jgi:hypothetical protein